jgi:hypothetical protein
MHSTSFRVGVSVAVVACLALLSSIQPAQADIGGWPFYSGSFVCAKWNAEWPLTTSTYATGVDTASCTEGAVTQQTKTDVLRVVNLFRFLAGIDAVQTMDSTKDVNTQECALMCARANTIKHTGWVSTDACYTAAGSSGCGTSNLAQGLAAPNAIIALYIQENGVPSLGHRRWVFSPTLNGISFGLVGVFSSLHVFGTQPNNLTRAYWSWPPQGYVPLQAVLAQGTPNTWNWASPATIAAITTCTVTYGGASVLSGACYAENSGYGYYQAVRWDEFSRRDSNFDSLLFCRRSECLSPRHWPIVPGATMLF